MSDLAATRAGNIEHRTWYLSKDPAWTNSRDVMRGPVVETGPFREAVA
jgi:hypothetical protein